MSMTRLDIAWNPEKARINQAKHSVSLAEGGSVLLDPLALTVFDAAHSRDEERWFTLGVSAQGALLAVAHTYRATGASSATVWIISARAATRQERRYYEDKQRP